jgi:glycerophosphoryl diester phosphodiesterase
MHYFCCLIIVLSSNATADWATVVPKHHGVFVVAHRGAHTDIPENTLAAYRRAIELGVDYVEVDLRTARDGRLVSVHNATVDAYCVDGTTGKVAELTLEELKGLDIGSRIGAQWAQERVPTFEEILEVCQGNCGIYLDLKDAAVAPVVEMLRKYGMAETTLWYASPARLREMATTCPECVAMPDPLVPQRLDKIIEEFKPVVVAASWDALTEEFVKRCHQSGAKVIVDEDTPECWGTALDWGVDGIQTDDPAGLIAFLQARESNSEPGAAR